MSKIYTKFMQLNIKIKTPQTTQFKKWAEDLYLGDRDFSKEDIKMAKKKKKSHMQRCSTSLAQIKTTTGSFHVSQGVKDPIFSLQQLGFLLWWKFDPWSENLHMLQVWPNKTTTHTHKTTIGCYLTSVVIKISTNDKCCRGHGEQEPSYTVGRSVN